MGDNVAEDSKARVLRKIEPKTNKVSNAATTNDAIDSQDNAPINRRKRRRLRRYTRIKRRNIRHTRASFSGTDGCNPMNFVREKLRKGVAAILANKTRLNERLDVIKTRKTLEDEIASSTSSFLSNSNRAARDAKRMAKRMSLGERRKMLEADIANDAINDISETTDSKLDDQDQKQNVDIFAHMNEEELTYLMEPEILIETQDECFVEYNVESSISTPSEPNQLLHFLSANSDYDPSLTNETAVTPQNIPQKMTRQNPKTHEVRVPSLTALVKVPVGKILCNFGHVIEQARKLERHTLQCGLGGEMVYHMTLKTGSVYEAVYRCSQPNCAVRMTIESDFHDKIMSY
ncbi:hypothetical protein CHUAL_003988 [Chamberlinius hualienensis]